MRGDVLIHQPVISEIVGELHDGIIKYWKSSEI